ncbi:CLUMA_CG007457, isoform A [Clunio marinus]|uniref:CLUMA_CG007457, isoform A n=1 Tax=Clunio marinus TaxID=568069 RepID=A0A1J1I2D8_9DIPT|nr:CLUMA_CG007457, isoform A [Clunio marinus]
MKKNIPTRPNIYSFLQKLMSLVNETHMKFLYEEVNGVRNIDHSCTSQKLETALKRLNDGEYNVKDFLIHMRCQIN